MSVDLDKITPQNDVVFKMIFADPEKRRLIQEREDAIRNYNNAISVALEQGRAEEREKAAKKMLAKGLDISDIADFTGLSIKEIQLL